MLPERTDNDVAADAMAEADGVSTEPAAADAEATETKVTAEAPSTITNESPAEDAPAEADEILPAPEQKQPAVAAATAAANDPHAYDGPSIPFVPHHALTEGMMALAFLTAGVIFIALIPAPLDARANAFLSPEGVLPEWYLLAPFELLHLVPPLPGELFMGLCIGLLMLWPFVDRRPRRISRRPFMLIFSFVIIGAVVALSVMALMHVEHL
jgi:quinol-cytochrome oxidoreductase complex cytochrome b subunit